MKSSLLTVLALPVLLPLQDAAPVAVLERADGTLERMALGRIGPAELAESKANFVRFEGLDPAPTVGPELDLAWVEMASGDRLLGTIEGGSGDELALLLFGAARLNLSIDDLSSVRLEGRASAAERASMQPAEEADRIYWVTSGGLDRDDGTLLELTPEGVEFEGRIGTKLHRWSDLAGLFLQDLGFEDASERGPATVVLDLVDLGRLRGELLGIDAEACTLELRDGASVRLPLGAVASLFRDDGSVVFLSDLEARVERDGSPFDDDLGMRWPPARDRSVTGAPLVVNGRTYTRGVGVHAPSTLVYALDGSFASLRGAVGIDDQVLRLASRGSVEFRVLADGEVRWKSGLVRGGEPERTLGPVDVSGARELVLEVDMTTDYHVADRADWLRVRLVRAD